MALDHQPPGLVIFGQRVMGRRPLHPTGYLPVWPWGPHGPLGQVDLYGLIAISPLDR